MARSSKSGFDQISTVRRLPTRTLRGGRTEGWPIEPSRNSPPLTLGDLAQHLIARDHVVELVSLGANDEGCLLAHGAAVEGGAAGQAVRARVEAGEIGSGPRRRRRW